MELTRFPTRLAHGSKHTIDPELIVKVENVRYSVPATYSSGIEFSRLSAAVAHAEAQIVELDYLDSDTSYPAQTRSFVDRRALITLSDGSSRDVVVDRIEVIRPTEAEGADVLEAFLDGVAAPSTREYEPDEETGLSGHPDGNGERY